MRVGEVRPTGGSASSSSRMPNSYTVQQRHVSCARASQLDSKTATIHTSADQVRVGSAVEVFSSADQRWYVGWIVEQDTNGVVKCVVNDGTTAVKPKYAKQPDPAHAKSSAASPSAVLQQSQKHVEALKEELAHAQEQLKYMLAELRRKDLELDRCKGELALSKSLCEERESLIEVLRNKAAKVQSERDNEAVEALPQVDTQAWHFEPTDSTPATAVVGDHLVRSASTRDARGEVLPVGGSLTNSERELPVLVQTSISSEEVRGYIAGDISKEMSEPWAAVANAATVAVAQAAAAARKEEKVSTVEASPLDDAEQRPEPGPAATEKNEAPPTNSPLTSSAMASSPSVQRSSLGSLSMQPLVGGTDMSALSEAGSSSVLCTSAGVITRAGRKSLEKLVDVHITVPRAFAPDEVEETWQQEAVVQPLLPAATVVSQRAPMVNRAASVPTVPVSALSRLDMPVTKLSKPQGKSFEAAVSAPSQSQQLFRFITNGGTVQSSSTNMVQEQCAAASPAAVRSAVSSSIQAGAQAAAAAAISRVVQPVGRSTLGVTYRR
mmetsp:Transcript_36812/g.84798  ORF Transcript_36812/g.84798 Transcript_36812/m.84798 type:complete len:552 (-) Transcript_36812:124-1779(-)